MEVRGWESAFESEMIFLAGRELIEFKNFEAKKIGQIMRIACVRRHVVFIDESRVECCDQCAAILNVEFESIRFTAREEMERRGDNEFIAREIFGRAGEVDGNIAIVKSQ